MSILWIASPSLSSGAYSRGRLPPTRWLAVAVSNPLFHASEDAALSIPNWLLRAKYHAFWKRMLRLIGVGAAGVGQEWIAVTSAATAGGHRLALLHGLKAAGAHSGSDVLAAIFTRRRWRRHRDKRKCEQRRGRRRGDFQKLFHLVLSVLALAPKSTHGMAVTPAPSSQKNSNGILSRVREKIENHRGTTVLKYDHHSNGSAPGSADRI